MAVHGIKCPKCGLNTVECLHTVTGSTAYYDSYYHLCKNPKCDYSEKSLDNYGGQVGQETSDDLPICPMCGTNHCAQTS